MAAVRMMSEQKLGELSDRIDQIARGNDPDPTAAQLALLPGSRREADVIVKSYESQ